MTSFKALEQSGWTQKASAYDAHFATIADQAIEPILDSCGRRCRVRRARYLLRHRQSRPRGCSTRRTCHRDRFRADLIEIARSKVAGADFQVGDAEALQFPNESFDIALAPSVCGICPSRTGRWQRRRGCSSQRRLRIHNLAAAAARLGYVRSPHEGRSSARHSGRRRADEGPQMFERLNMSATQRPHNHVRFGKSARFGATTENLAKFE